MTQQTTRDQLRNGFLEQAKRPFVELSPLLVESRTSLLAALKGVSEGQARFKPPGREGEDAWSIAEVVRHVIEVETVMAERVLRLGRGEPAPGSTPGRLGGREGLTLTALIDSLQTARESLLASANELGGGERLDTTAPHAFFGDLNCRAWFAFHAFHERLHANQVEEVKAAPGYPAS